MESILASSDYGLVFFLVLIPIAILSIVWTFSRSAKMLEEWARANGFRLLEKEYRWFTKGPFFWRSGKNQTVYRITVQDSQGQVHRGWARCGGWFMGLWSNQVDVRWDEQPRHQPGFPVVMHDPGQPEDHRSH